MKNYNSKSSKQKTKFQKNKFHGSIFPILFILALFPFITYLYVYENLYGSFSWFSQNTTSTDFFTYYKGCTLITIAVICVFMLITALLARELQRPLTKMFLPLFIYEVFVLLSTIFSSYVKISLSGTNGHFEGLYVLLAYMILLIYSYCIFDSKRDIKPIFYALAFCSIISVLLGLTQYFIQDPIQWSFIQKMTMGEYYGSEVSSILRLKKVPLATGNPNYASIFLSMIISFFLSFALFSKEKKQRIVSIVLSLLLSIVLFLTMSRTGLLSLIAVVFVLLLLYRKEILRYKKAFAITISGFILLFVITDGVSGFTFSNRIVRTFESLVKSGYSASLQEITTNKEDISILYKNEELHIAFDNSDTQKALVFYDKEHKNITEYYDASSNTLSVKPFDEMKFSTTFKNPRNIIQVNINDVIWDFCYDSNNHYAYFNAYGKEEYLTPVKSFGFKGKETLASSRGYIWSRSLPLLSKHLLLGSGPDTFAIEYPQNDRVGKMNYSKIVYSIIEKAHSLYLQIGIQTGVVSLLCLLVFFILYLKQSFSCYRKLPDSPLEVFGLAALLVVINYLICGFFMDSVIQTTPLCYIMIGCGMGANHEIKKQRN